MKSHQGLIPLDFLDFWGYPFIDINKQIQPEDDFDHEHKCYTQKLTLVLHNAGDKPVLYIGVWGAQRSAKSKCSNADIHLQFKWLFQVQDASVCLLLNVCVYPLLSRQRTPYTPNNLLILNSMMQIHKPVHHTHVYI